MKVNLTYHLEPTLGAKGFVFVKTDDFQKSGPAFRGLNNNKARELEVQAFKQDGILELCGDLSLHPVYTISV